MAEDFSFSGRQDIPNEAWEDARKRLIFYFSHHGGSDPQDLAQEALTRLLGWLSTGKKIEGVNGFQKLCYGFAKNVLYEDKDTPNRQTEPLDEDVKATANTTRGLNSNESRILVGELLARLSPEDRQLVLAAECMDPKHLATRFGTSVKNVNVKVFRARQRLRNIAQTEMKSTGN
jgi:DNA-directed RNA polymerase specialized sigma24 family protein